MEKEFKNHISSLTANTTYIVSENCTISNSLTLPEGVSLVFRGGIISVTGALTGNRTSIVAPITQIFNIVSADKLAGSWAMPQAYPQWFGAKADGSTNCSEAINKAILFKNTGEVFLPRGMYSIQNIIKVKSGIVLKGDKAFISNTNPNNAAKAGTVLIPSNSLGTNFMIHVNIASGTTQATATWDNSYATLVTAIEDICFYNPNSNYAANGILSAGAIEIKRCRWRDFQQALATANTCYSDNKTDTDCYFGCSIACNCHAFDMSGLGDNLCFKRNHIIHDMVLCLNKCNGGEVCGNILNGVVEIKNSKSISYAANHCEKNAQLLIDNSNVNVSNCFFEKHTSHSISVTGTTYIDTSVVSINDCAFLFYDYSPTNTYDGTGCGFDIQTNKIATISIRNSFRYWVLRNSITKMYTCGITICDEASKPLTSFNDFSYLFSNQCVIKPNFIINKNHSIQALNNINVNAQKNSGVMWKKTAGVAYSYSYQIIWDTERGIANNRSSNLSVTPESNAGVLLILSIGLNGYQALIRLFRECGTEKVYVDIPVCGTKHLYDNGNNISGFTWNPYTTIPSISNNLVPTGAIEYHGNNVICRATGTPMRHNGWEAGDIVINTGNGTTALWRFNGSSWL